MSHIDDVRARNQGQQPPKYYGANVTPDTGELFDGYAAPGSGTPPFTTGHQRNRKARARAKAARQARKKNRR